MIGFGGGKKRKRKRKGGGEQKKRKLHWQKVCKHGEKKRNKPGGHDYQKTCKSPRVGRKKRENDSNLRCANVLSSKRRWLEAKTITRM